MSKIIELISGLKKLGINLSISGSNIKINSKNKDNLSSEIISEIKENKQELVEFLKGVKKRKQNKLFQSIISTPYKDHYSLSSAQKRMYLLQQMSVDSTAYNMPQYFPIGEVSLEKIQEAVTSLIEHHASFRTSFVLIDDVPKQKILSEVDLTIEKYEVLGLLELEGLYEDFIKPFDLSEAPLLRVAYVKDRSNNESYLLTDMHHIISDGISMDLLQEDFTKLLSKKPLEPLKL